MNTNKFRLIDPPPRRDIGGLTYCAATAVSRGTDRPPKSGLRNNFAVLNQDLEDVVRLYIFMHAPAEPMPSQQGQKGEKMPSTQTRSRASRWHCCPSSPQQQMRMREGLRNVAVARLHRFHEIPILSAASTPVLVV